MCVSIVLSIDDLAIDSGDEILSHFGFDPLQFLCGLDYDGTQSGRQGNDAICITQDEVAR
jgi:hypothetical protein